MESRILIADVDPATREALVVTCEALGHRSFEAGSARQTVEVARRAAPDLVLLDAEMPGGGLETLPRLLELEPRPQVVLVAQRADVPSAVEAMRLGACDFLEKPIRTGQIKELMERVRRDPAVTRERDLLRGEVARLRSGPIVGRSRAVARVHEQIQRVASTPRTTVLVTGESGVGKELVARAVHEGSARAEGPFVAVNCAALAENLLEAELFGYEGGAFSGADPKGKEGLVAAARGGTLFLDEVGELALELQAKLLRVLQERVYRRVGGSEDLPTDVRFVASTNRDLGRLVEEGRFREDLYYRLNVLSIVVPPLRERREDIPELAQHFVELYRREFGHERSALAEEALEALGNHPWRGNVRELRNAIERGALRARGDRITSEDLGLAEGPETRRDPAAVQLDLEGFGLKQMEEQLIRRALEEARGNRSQTARLLGVNRTTLYNKLRAYQIEA